MTRGAQKIIIKKSSIEGKGVFASGNFKINERILTITGPTITYKVPPNWWIGSDWLNVGRNRWKIADSDNPWIFLNHSCRPNAILNNARRVVAIRPIGIDDEVTIDYSFTEAMPTWKMKCECGLPQCRGTIRSVQFLPEMLFKKYRKYMSQFLQKEYLTQKVCVEHVKNKCSVTAKRKIKKGEIAFTVEGPVIKYSVAPDSKIGFKWLGLGKNTWMIPYRQNPWSSLRHSCEPNVGLSGTTDVVALKNIEAGDEITIDDSITEADPNWKVTCTCGSKQCRKVIRSIQYLPEATFKKYYPYIPKLFQRVYTLDVRNG